MKIINSKLDRKSYKSFENVETNKSTKLLSNKFKLSNNSLANNPKLNCDNKVKLIDVRNDSRLSNLASVSRDSRTLFILSIFEITLLVLTTFSFSWMIGNTNSNNNNIPYDDLNKNIFGSLIKELINFIDIIPSVSAQTPSGVSCCINSQSGNSCREFPSSECGNECDGTCLPTSCGETTQCKAGCCYDKDEGLCDPNSLKQQCESRVNGNWIDAPFCETAECAKGCCVLGFSSQFVTEQRCTKLSQLEGMQMNFKPEITDELSCLGIANSEKTGACVYGEEIAEENNKRNCKFTTKQDCDSIPGDFNEGKLCSNTALNTVCEKQSSTNCLEGRDEIYWFDSCGNVENIYSSDKQRAWNNGLVLSESQSCNPNSNNAGSSTCGNCDYNLGSICGKFRPGIDDGNLEGYTCRDLNCKNLKKEVSDKSTRINGESWCVYDGPVGSLRDNTGGLASFVRNSLNFNNRENTGDSVLSNIIGRPVSSNSKIDIMSTDLVGSRHFRYVCENGEVVSEPCADYRKEVCVQNEKSLSNSKKIDEAICRVNLWEQCISANSDVIGSLTGIGCGPSCIQKCNSNPDCRLQVTYVDEFFRFATCVPRYPPGLDLSSTSGIGSMAQGYASGIAQSYLSDSIGGSIASGTLSSLGNNGGTDASQVCDLASKTCKVTYVKACFGGGWKCVNNCECQESSFTIQMSNLCSSLGDCGIKSNIAGRVTLGGAFIMKRGSKGHAPPQPFIMLPFHLWIATLQAKIQSGGFFKEQENILELAGQGLSDPFLAITSGALSGVNLMTPNIPEYGGFSAGGAAGGAAAGAAIGSFIPGVGTIIGAVLGAVLGGFFEDILAALFGCGKVKEVKISYNCQPWQRPSGDGRTVISRILERFERDENGLIARLNTKKGCEFCNNDKLKPCTKYRCESLGMRCKLINEGTGQDTCITDSQATGIPIITPWEEVLNKTLFSYQDVSNNGFRVRTAGNDCIEAFTILSFGVKTDVFSQCRWSMDNNITEFDEMMPFLEQNLFTKNHSLISILPSVESIIASETGNSEEFQQAIANPDIYNPILNQIGDLNIHVKCANIDGKTNDQNYRINFCVKPGPDLTPPVVYATTPPENAIVALNATQQEAIFFINEPSECRIDVIKPSSTNMQDAYFNLSNSMSCETDVFAGTLLGFPCNATLPLATGNEIKFYILCRDQPWLGENNSRNFGAKEGGVYEYKLQRSPSELKITSVSPSGVITRGAEPISIELEAITSGGGYNGIASCEFEGRDQNGNTWGDNFPETATSHKYLLSQMRRGNYTVNVKCLDAAGNYAENSTSFNLMLDTQYPSVTRIYYQSGDLTVLTDEDATCAYSNDNNSTTCGYDFETASKMNGNSREHSIVWDVNSTFYIKCADIWGNKPGSCSIIAKPNNVAGVR